MGLCCNTMENYKPHFFMILSSLSLAIFIVILQSLLSSGVSGPVLVVYEHIVATLLLFILAFIFEKKKRPPLTIQICCWAFFLGFLQITLCQLLLTSSLKYISATVQSIAINTTTPVVFLLAVISRQENFQILTLNGQAKLWGIIISAIGASVMVVWTGPELGRRTGFLVTGTWTLGCLMITGSILAAASWILLVERVANKYPADMSLSAMMSFSGTLQTAIVATITESTSAWNISYNGGLELVAIFYGGIVVTGLTYYAQTWCIHKKGPVFTSAFSPLLIVFSFLIETLVLRNAAHLGSIVGAVLVVGGLYLILWAKVDDREKVDLSIGDPLLGLPKVVSDLHEVQDS